MGSKSASFPTDSSRNPASSPDSPSVSSDSRSAKPPLGSGGGSSLLLNDESSGLSLPLGDEEEEEVIPPAAVMPPSAGVFSETETRGEELTSIHLDEAPAEPPPEVASDEPLPFEEPSQKAVQQITSEAAAEDDLRLVLLDEAPEETLPEVEPPPARPSPANGTSALGTESPLANDEIRLVAMDDAPAAEEKAIGSRPAVRSPQDESAASPWGEMGPSALLLGGETGAPADSSSREQPLPSPDATPRFRETDFSEGRSSLLLSGSEVEAPVRQETAVTEPSRRRHRRRERVRITPPKPGAEIQWFSNAEACATYCRKHSRPLLLYFTTGDVEQCRTYEEAIRLAEMQPFLCTYVCCMVNMAQAEGRQVAMRLGVPTNSPAVVLLSPSGREYARVLKAEVDWQFLATMLFWALR